MKKISNLELSSLVLVIISSMNTLINKSLLTSNYSVNSWFILLISFIIGFIPIYIILYIANYNIDDNLNNNIKSLFKNTYYIFYIIILIIYFVIGLTILYNISTFIKLQFLYKTPIYICGLLLVVLVIYNINKGINTITRVSFILVILNLIMFSISCISLINEFNIDNLKPFLIIDNNNIISTLLLVSLYITLPLLIILIIPRNKLDHPDKYNKTVIISYIIGGIISIINNFLTMGVLGKYITDIATYPEYIVLKKVKLLGFVERVENLLGNQWTIGVFIYLSLILYYIGGTINFKKKNIKYFNIGISLMLFITTFLLFDNSVIFRNYLFKIFPYIIMGLIPIYIVLFMKILINNRKKKV